MQIDISTSHGKYGRGEPPELSECMRMLRVTLERAGLTQINVSPNYVVLGALKALSDSGYTIVDGSSINLSRPVRKDIGTKLSMEHSTAIRSLLLNMGSHVSDVDTAQCKPDFDGYLVDGLISTVMALNMRAVDGATFKAVTDELSHMTQMVTSTVGVAKDWGLPEPSTLTSLVVHVLNYYHNSWYRCLWRWWLSLFSPFHSVKGDD